MRVKKIISLILVAILCLSFTTACSSSKAKSEEKLGFVLEGWQGDFRYQMKNGYEMTSYSKSCSFVKDGIDETFYEGCFLEINEINDEYLVIVNVDGVVERQGNPYSEMPLKMDFILAYKPADAKTKADVKIDKYDTYEKLLAAVKAKNLSLGEWQEFE